MPCKEATQATWETCPGEIRIVTHDRNWKWDSQCMCEPFLPYPDLLGGSSSELMIVKLSPAILAVFTLLRVLQWRPWRIARWCTSKGCASFFCAHVSRVFFQLCADCEQASRRLFASRDFRLCGLVEQKRCQFAGKLVSVFSVLGLVMFALFVNDLQTEMPKDGDALGPAHPLRAALLGQPFLPVAFVCAVFIGLNQHSVLKPVVLDCANVALSGMWIWRYFTMDGKGYTFHSSLICACRLLQGITLGNARLTIGLHFIVTLADTTAYRVM